VQKTGCLAAWRNATEKQRLALVRHLLLGFPLTCCKNMFYVKNNAFDFDNIWASECEETAAWRTF